MGSKYDKYADEWVELYNSGVTLTKIVKDYDTYLSAVWRVLMSRGVEIRPTAQCLQIHNRYGDEWFKLHNSGHTLGWIGRKYGACSVTVSSVIRRAGHTVVPLPAIIYKNQDMFERIDNEVSAYYLGMIWTDGCISESSKGEDTSPVLTLALNEKDGYLVEYLADYIGANVHYLKPTYRGFSNGGRLVSIAVQNRRIGGALLDLGVVPRKSKVETFVDVSRILSKYWNSFVRGLLDGDGHVGLYTNKNGGTTRAANVILNILGVNIVGDYIHTTLGIDKRIYTYKRKYKGRDSNITTLNWNSYGAYCKMYKWLYSDATIYMLRKKLVFTKIINSIPQKYIDEYIPGMRLENI